MFRHKRLVVLAAPLVAAIWCLNAFAFRYLTDDIAILGIYWSRRQWLHAHIGGGIAPLLIGPILLWIGSCRQHTLVYRLVLIPYVLGVAISGTAAAYLALHTDFGFVVGIGFATAAVAWLSSTILAVVAICRSMNEQHREWLIRSFVLTFSFVAFRIFVEIFNLSGRGNLVEQMTASCWLSWSVPLMIAEIFLQGGKIFAHVEHPAPVQTTWPSAPNASSITNP
jgi:hypothetical protein